MNKLAHASLVIVAVLIACAEHEPNETPPAIMFRGDAQHRGVYKGQAVHQFESVRWAFKTNGPVRSTPAVRARRVYFGSGDSCLYALDALTGNEQWRFKTNGAVHSSPALAHGAVYFTSRDECFYAVNTRDGKLLAKFQTGATRAYPWGFDYFLSSPLIVGDIAYFGSGDGHLYALDLRRNQLKWKFDTQSLVRSSPALFEQTIFFGDTKGYLYALDAETGAEQWRFATEGVKFNPVEFGFDRCAIISSPAISEDAVVFGGRDGFLYALERGTGKERWRFDHEISWVISSPAIYNGAAITGTSDGRFVQAVNLATGKEQWRFNATETVWSSPTVCDSLVYFGDGGGNVFAVHARNGAEQWRFKTRDRIFSSPIVSEGVVYIGSDDGYLYALTGATSNGSKARKAKRAVYWEASKGFNWFRHDVDEQIRDYFVREGYELLEAQGLARFMQESIANRSSSVVVFAASRVPATVIDDSSEAALLRKYLNAGGKVVWLGAPPLVYRRDPKTDQVTELDFTIPERIVGVRYQGQSALGVNGWYRSSVTREGMQWGLLRDWWIGGFAVNEAQVTTVLGRDEQGNASAWVKNYGGREGTGLVQLWHKREGSEDLVAIKAVAEYGLR